MVRVVFSCDMVLRVVFFWGHVKVSLFGVVWEVVSSGWWSCLPGETWGWVLVWGWVLLVFSVIALAVAAAKLSDGLACASYD